MSGIVESTSAASRIRFMILRRTLVSEAVASTPPSWRSTSETAALNRSVENTSPVIRPNSMPILTTRLLGSILAISETAFSATAERRSA